LKLLYVSIEDKPPEWFLENLQSLKGWLERPFNLNDPILDELSAPIMTRVISSLPTPASEDEVPAAVQEFYSWTHGIVNEGIRSNSHVPLILTVLHALVRKNPPSLEEFAGNLSKMFGKVARECIQIPASSQPHAPNQVRQVNEPATRTVKSLLEIWRTQMPVSSEHRKSVLFTFQGLVEKSMDVSVCRLILDMCREWVFARHDGFPTMREKAGLLAKMTCLEYKRFEEPILADFLNLILDVYKEPSLRRTDLTIKLESAFLVGCRSKDPVVRLKFVELFDDSLPRALASRLQWVLGSQTWEYLAEHFWIPQALELLLGSVNDDTVVVPALHDVDMSGSSPSARFGTRPITVMQLLRPSKQLLHLDADTTHQMWVITFAALWRVLSRKEQGDTHKSLVLLLAKDYHTRQLVLRRNVIQSLLAGVLGCQPPLALPPFVIKYLGKTFNAWHIALELLQDSLKHLRDEETVRDAALDALAELYAELSEDDWFYGMWRRRALYTETNVALSFEQNGLWQDAQLMYESAQLRARSGGAPFNEQEYCLWEDHWILTAQKLQQWDTLTELANQEGNHDLLLECAWRLSDWEKDRETIERSILAVADVATPRRRVFEAFTCLIRGNPMSERPDFTRLLEDAMQLSLRKWISLPPVVSTVHVPLLQHFQQLVELQEAAQIFHALATTTSMNLEKRSSDLKVVLQAWRERLPNLWDDISVWSDLVSWRQHVFQTINKKFLPLIQQNNGPQGVNGSSTAGYRGYHEIAWIINRFAHVARKHGLLEVCHSSLSRIYTLPNIEISEAFLKLREQARCHYQVPSELQAGLEVINNTNLMYFSVPQKAEFFTLKGMFIAKLGHNDEANAAFGQAVQMDLNMPKAWAEWGRYNDHTFKENPTDMVVASNAVSCYLQAAGLYKNSKTRPLLIRILWFLSLDDPVATISKAFENFKGDIALWYWITLIPQLLKALSHRAARHARRLLNDLARTYPQVKSLISWRRYKFSP
jgi:transformation/transcription domain-associated protein